MAKTKAKRRRKHRGTQAGTVAPVEARGHGGSGRGGSPAEKAAKREAARRRRVERMDRPPTWRASAIRAGLAAVFVAIVLIALGRSPQQALLLAVVALVVYVPLGYVFDTFVYRLRQRRKGTGPAGERKKGGGKADDARPNPGARRRGRSRGEG
jgi:hypothetical protein